MAGEPLPPHGVGGAPLPTGGHPIVVAKTPCRKSTRRPRFLVYGHYDVQPPEPFELWQSPPFEPRIAGRSLYARGAADNKGQHLAHLKAVEAYLKTGTELPCDLTFVIEGEEEVGSNSLASFLKRHRAELGCDVIVISDTGMPSLKHPALTYALRGIIAFEITLRGPARDLHSGIFGGAVNNPAMALCQLLGRLRDPNGRVTIPGFYDDVVPLSTYERKELARLPLKDRDFKKLLGVPELFGERGYSAEEQRGARPTFEINGLTSGYQGEGSKTIVPAWARAKITCRLVPGQNPGTDPQAGWPTPRPRLPAIGPAWTRGGARSRAVSGFAGKQTGAGGLARVEGRLPLPAGAAARRRLDPDCDGDETDSGRGLAPAGAGAAGCQRPFPE